MATIKAVSSGAKIGTAIDYVLKPEKTAPDLVTGIGCQPETAKAEMQVTKELYGKTGGRTYKHFTQSYAPGENITPEQAHQNAVRLAGEIPAWKGFEVLIATHIDKDHIHTHFIVNSVSAEDGHKLQWSKRDLAAMKEASDQICRENNLTVCEKGKTFYGENREETSTYTKEAHQQLTKAEAGEVESYVQSIALAVMDCRERAVSRQDFCDQMEERGYHVNWSDTRKHITFTDLARELEGEKKCKIRNNKLEQYYHIDFGKEALEHEFTVNAARTEAREQLRRGSDQGTEPADLGSGTQGADAFIRELEANERAAAEKRQARDAERKRQRAEAERRSAERKQKTAERTRRSSGPSLD